MSAPDLSKVPGLLHRTGILDTILQTEFDPETFDEATEILDRFATGIGAGKKRMTMIAVATSDAFGFPRARVWGDDGPSNVATQNTFYNWCSDIDGFKQAMEDLAEVYRRHLIKSSLLNLSRASMIMSFSAPMAAMKAAEVTANSHDDNVILRGAFGILDRADFQTAQKTGSMVRGSSGDQYDANRLSDEEADLYVALLEKMKIPVVTAE